MIKSQLGETIARHLREQETEILKELETKEECYTIIKLFYEEGEVLITLLMDEDEIENSVKEAVNEVFTGKTVIDIFISQSKEVISFTIITT